MCVCERPRDREGRDRGPEREAEAEAEPEVSAEPSSDREEPLVSVLLFEGGDTEAGAGAAVAAAVVEGPLVACDAEAEADAAVVAGALSEVGALPAIQREHEKQKSGTGRTSTNTGATRKAKQPETQPHDRQSTRTDESEQTSQRLIIQRQMRVCTGNKQNHRESVFCSTSIFQCIPPSGRKERARKNCSVAFLSSSDSNFGNSCSTTRQRKRRLLDFTLKPSID